MEPTPSPTPNLPGLDGPGDHQSFPRKFRGESNALVVELRWEWAGFLDIDHWWMFFFPLMYFLVDLAWNKTLKLKLLNGFFLTDFREIAMSSMLQFVGMQQFVWFPKSDDDPWAEKLPIVVSTGGFYG